MNADRLVVARRQQLHHAIPHRPSNVERVKAYRALAPVERGNARFVERFRAREYERAEIADARDRATDPDFSFSYGA